MSSILIVEDEPFVDSDLRATLAALGHEVTATTTTSENALAKVAPTRPDLVFMKMRRKGLDDAARLHTEYGVPVIHLNPAVDEPGLEQPEVTRPYGYLLKPFAERELQSTIEVALDPHGMQRALAVRDRW
ncbi:MAG: response regulator, partial [Gallionellaceae bacterium]